MRRRRSETVARDRTWRDPMLYGTSDETPPRSGQRDALTRVEVGDGPPLPLSGEINGFEFTDVASVALATLTDWAVVASLSETVRDYLAR